MVKNKRLKFKIKELSSSARLIIIILSCMFVGSLIGSIYANTIDYMQHNNISSNMENLFYNLNYTILSKRELLIDSFFRYGLSVVIIWIMGFLLIGSAITFLVIGLMGASIGFTTSFLMIEYGLVGIWYAIVLYIPQNLLIVPLYVFIAYSSVKFALRGAEKQNNKNSINKRKGIDLEVLEYAVVLVLSLSLIFLVSLYESYLAPSFINFMISP